jgi:hypothetical protein
VAGTRSSRDIQHQTVGSSPPRSRQVAQVMNERRDTRLRFEQWARNPSCEANRISAVHGVPMAEVVRREHGQPTMGQSPFALARGQMFEQVLLRNNGLRLRESLIQTGVLPASATGFQDFRLRQNRGPFRTLDEAREATSVFFKNMATATDPGQVPVVVAGAVVCVPGRAMLPEAILVIDVLAVTWVARRPVLVVGEVKTYPDRGGYTDGAELATARAQAGVYVHGLRQVLTELGVADRIAVADRGFLVLSRPGSNRPSIRANEDLRYQVERAAKGFERLRAVAASLPGTVDSELVLETILRASTEYEQGCVSFCDRAALCHERALEAGDPRALGEEVARLLGHTTLGRVVELLAGARPNDATERDLIRRLTEAERGRAAS